MGGDVETLFSPELIQVQSFGVECKRMPEASHGSILQSDMILSYMQLYQQDCGAPLHRSLQKFRFRGLSHFLVILIIFAFVHALKGRVVSRIDEL
ncbi:hypothetical protein SDJN03_14216, partial [Cucurbita argyrosperma subsp. sororia]